jgi:RimJ/RimL family protein N-acetyltransferase
LTGHGSPPEGGFVERILSLSDTGREEIVAEEEDHAMTRIHRVGPETSRLRLRALTVDDAEAVLALNGNPVVMTHTGEPLWTGLEQTRPRLADYPDFEKYGFGRWGCIYKPENEVIGFSGFKYLPTLDEVDLGYRFLPEYWGQGLATESGSACILYGFETMGLDHIIALVKPENTRSVRVLEKLGMHDTGVTSIDGDPVHRYVIERSEWLRSSPARN